MKKLLFFCLSFVFSLCHLFGTPKIGVGYEEIENRCELSILNPVLSERKIAKIKLHNGLEALLISDPGIEQSAAALSVEAGSWQDPEEYPGMAHFLEHMLFMGTKAYPLEGEYMQYISDNGGKVNAYTACDRTVYMLSINNDAFTGALDRFSHFFIDPLFSPSCIDRELHAVDQEHSKNIENDNWRQYMIFKETCNTQHPLHKFSTGNAQTLMGIPQEAMKQWYQMHYGANRMHLVVLSSLPIDDLIRITLQDFSKVPTNDYTHDPLQMSMTSSNQRGHMMYIKPVKDLKTLSLTWELPAEFATDQETKVSELVAFVLNQKNPNGLEAQLKKEKIAESVRVSVEHLGKKNALFTIEIELTTQGLSQIDTAITRVFQALSSLKTSGIPYYLFEEMKRIAELQYEYQSREDAFDFVLKQAHQMVDEPLTSYPQKTLMPSTYDPELVSAFLETLTPDSCLFSVTASPEKMGVNCNVKEKWMGAEYRLQKVSQEKILAWDRSSPHPSLGLPTANPYIPQNLSLIHSDSFDKTSPVAIQDDNSGKIYFLNDEKYQVPELLTIFNFKTPLLDGSAKSKAFGDLYLKALAEQMRSQLALASTVGFLCDFQQKDLSLSFTIYGYSDKSPTLAKELLQTLRNVKPSRDLFEIYKQSIISSYENATKELPLAQSMEMMGNLLFDTCPTSFEKLKAIKTITYDDFLQFSTALFKKSYLEGLIYGNFTQAEATHLTTQVKQILKSEPYAVSEQKKRHILLLPEKQGPYMLVQNTPMLGNAVLLVMEEGEFSLEKRGVQQILSKALRESFFETLRTKQQTAYIARSWDAEEEKQLLQFFAVQSSTHQPNELIARFELFLENFNKNLGKKVSQERFENLRAMLIATLQMPPENLYVMGTLLFKLGFEYEGDFKWIEKRIQSVKNLSYNQFLKISQNFLSRENTRRLALLMEGVLPPKNDFRYELISQENLKTIGTYVTSQEAVSEFLNLRNQ